MKITIHHAPHGYTILKPDDPQDNYLSVYIHDRHMEAILKGEFTMVYDSQALLIFSDCLIIYPSVLSHLTYRKNFAMIPVNARWIRMDTRRFFQRVSENVSRLGDDKYFDMDSESFCNRRQPDFTPLSYVQIMAHPLFQGKESLYRAVRCKIPRRKFISQIQCPFDGYYWDDHGGNGLRELLSMYLNKGATITCDGYNTPCFMFFYPSTPEKRGLYGAITYHGKYDGYGSGGAPTFSVCLTPTDGWSVHT